MNQDQKHYKPGSPIPMEFNDPGLRKREMPPKRKKESGNISGKKSSVRCKVKHVFAVVKRLFGYCKTRYRGLRKQTAKKYNMFTLANLYLADRKTLSV